ncbi:MAG: hypothetical protein K2I93_04005, partial [Oscillospiraceae bacterium]|nr:hypothetical protein [Oscillospiraceae bacterium]
MKNKNTRRIVAGVFAAALVLQSTAMTTISAFADESGTDTTATDTTTPSAPDADTASDAIDAIEPAPEQTAPAEPDQSPEDDAEPQSDALTITGGTVVPSEVQQGDFLIVKGTITSASSDITSVVVGIYDVNGTKLCGGTADEPASKTYDLNRLDRFVSFDKLAAGTYVYRVTASNASGSNVILSEQTFTVANHDVVADTLTVTGGTSVPAELKSGSIVNVKGTLVSASSNITAVSVGVYDASGNKVSGGSAEPNTKTFDLSTLDDAVSFDTLAVGTYAYKVIATNSGNANYTVISQEFTVVADSVTADTLTITGGLNVPDTLTQGKALNVTGVVTSASSDIVTLTVGVYDAEGKFVTGSTIAPKVKSYDLRRLDNDVKFSQLSAGKYTYAVIASNAANTNYALVNKQFTVEGQSAQTDTLAITGAATIPDNLEQGKSLSISGTVTSASSNITALTAGVYDANGKFVTGRTIAPNAKSYSLKNLDAYVAFNKLAAGSYTYAVIASNAGNNNYALVNKQFVVGNANTPSATDDKLTITGGMTVPESLAVGKALNVTGVVTSASSNMTALTVGVYDMDGKFVTGRTIAPNAKSYDLKRLDAYVAFNKLAAGKYVYAVIATNAANANYALVNKQFIVGNGNTPSTPSAEDDKLTITGGTNVPDTLAVGKALNVVGTVTSASSNITALTVGVYDADGKFVTGRTINPNSKTYNLRLLDAYVAFNKLAEGSYTYAVIATNSGNTNYALVNKKFTVGNGTPSTTDDKLTITGGTNVPDTLAVGKALNVIGTVTSASSNITALTVGVYDANGKFVTGRTINPNAKSYDLKNLDAYVAFNNLAEGSYTYAVIASNAANTN